MHRFDGDHPELMVGVAVFVWLALSLRVLVALTALFYERVRLRLAPDDCARMLA